MEKKNEPIRLSPEKTVVAAFNAGYTAAQTRFQSVADIVATAQDAAKKYMAIKARREEGEEYKSKIRNQTVKLLTANSLEGMIDVAKEIYNCHIGERKK